MQKEEVNLSSEICKARALLVETDPIVHAGFSYSVHLMRCGGFNSLPLIEKSVKDFMKVLSWMFLTS